MGQCRNVFLFSLCLLAACSGGGGGGGAAQVVAGQRVGVAGGMLQLTTGELAGLEIAVPPGATTAPVQLTVATSFAQIQPGFSNLSRGILLGPSPREFALPVAVTLPFEAGRQGRAAVVLARQQDGRVIEIAGVTEPDTGKVRFQTLNFPAVYWVAQRLLGWVTTNPQGVFGSTPGFLPLQTGNRWNFSNGITITLTASAAEPNLQGVTVFRLLIETPDQNLGLYLRRIDSPPFAYGPTDVLGEYSTNGGTDYQEIHDLSLFLPAEVTLGQPMLSVLPALLYQPYGTAAPTTSATTILRVLPTGVPPLRTAVGRFDDVFQLDWSMEARAPNGARQSAAVVMTLARGVGPIAVQVAGIAGVLTSGTVNGQPIQGAN